MNDFFVWNLSRPRPWEELPALSEQEVEELFGLFDAPGLPKDAMNAEMADGYLTACMIGPELPPVHEWMEAIFGQPTLPICADADRQERILTLLLRRCGDIQEALSVSLKQVAADKLFVPLTAQLSDEAAASPYVIDESGQRQGHWELKDWANGFRRAMFEDPRWNILFDDSEWWSLLTPVILFQMGHNPDKPEMRVGEQDDLLPLLISCLYEIREYWRAHNRRLIDAMDTESRSPVRRGAKTGRNEPCPCGSGKKYKKCCGA